MYFFSFLLFGKLSLSPSILNENLVGYSSLGYKFLFFINWTLSCQSPLACTVYVEKSADNLIGAPLHVTSCFSLFAFKIISMSLNFFILIMIVLGMDLSGFLLTGTLHVSWTCMISPLTKLGKFSVILSKRFSIPCPFSLPSYIPIMQVLLYFMLSLSSLILSSFILSLFFIFFLWVLLLLLLFFVFQLSDSVLCFI